MDLKALYEKRQALLDEHKKLVDTLTKEKRELSEDESTRHAEIRDAISKLNSQIEDAKFFAEQRANQEALRNDLAANGIQRHYNVSETETGAKPSKEDEKTLRQFSFIKFLREAGDNRLTGVEAEMEQESRIEAAHSGVEIRNFGIPQVLIGHRSSEKRDHTVGTNSAGGFAVATELRGFIEVLRERLVLTNLGATFMSGLVGNVAIPRQITRTSPTEAAENATAGEENITFNQLSLSPKRLAAFSDLSKQLLIQSSPDIEALVINDLLAQIQLRIQDMAINGSGSSNQPTGILNVSGIGDVAGGTNGAAPDHDDLVDLETEVANDNADLGRMGYLTNTKVRGKLKKTKVDAGSGLFVWPANESMLNGYSVAVSNTVPSTLDKGTASGVCSAIIFGNWQDLMIGQWGGLDVLVNPYTKSKEGLIEVNVDMFYDVGVRHAESFSAMQDALTA